MILLFCKTLHGFSFLVKLFAKSLTMGSLFNLALYGRQNIYLDGQEVPIYYPGEHTIEPEIINEMLCHYYGEDLLVLLMYFRRKTRSPMLARRILHEAIECVQYANWLDDSKRTYATHTKNGQYHGLFLDKRTIGKKLQPIVRATYNCFTNQG